jgi:hypothetical protein
MSDLKINYHGHVCIGENTIYIRVWYYLWFQAFAGGGGLETYHMDKWEAVYMETVGKPRTKILISAFCGARK